MHTQEQFDALQARIAELERNMANVLLRLAQHDTAIKGEKPGMSYQYSS